MTITYYVFRNTLLRPAGVDLCGFWDGGRNAHSFHTKAKVRNAYAGGDARAPMALTTGADRMGMGTLRYEDPRHALANAASDFIRKSAGYFCNLFSGNRKLVYFAE